MGLVNRIQQRASAKRQRREQQREEARALEVQARAIADVILRIGERYVGSATRPGSFSGADLKAMEAEIDRLSDGDDLLIVSALRDPRIIAWHQAWARQGTLPRSKRLPENELIRVNYFVSLSMRVQMGTKGRP